MNGIRKSSSLVLALCLVFFQLGGIPQAQTEEASTIQNRNPASQYYLERGTENKLMMKVNVWGAVANPGSQYVPDQIDLIGLLSAAGRPTEDANHKELRFDFRGGNR